MADVQKQCEDAVVSVIRSLSLKGLQASEIVARRRAWHQLGDGTWVIHRGITVFPEPEVEAPGTNEREDIGYGIGVAMIVPTTHNTSEGRDLVTTWRAALRRKIYHDALSIVLPSGLYLQTKVSHRELVLPKDADRFEVSGLLIRCWMRESRT